MLRRCGRCHLEKPPSDFAWRRIHKGQKDNYCTPCRAAYKQEHYSRNRQRYIDNAARRTERIVQERTQWVVDYLDQHPCTDCGESDVVVLEFDHVRDKVFSIAHGIRSFNWDRVVAEIEKCEVVCANCHRRRTARRGGFARAALANDNSQARLFFKLK